MTEVIKFANKEVSAGTLSKLDQDNVNYLKALLKTGPFWVMVNHGPIELGNRSIFETYVKGYYAGAINRLLDMLDDNLNENVLAELRLMGTTRDSGRVGMISLPLRYSEVFNKLVLVRLDNTWCITDLFIDGVSIHTLCANTMRLLGFTDEFLFGANQSDLTIKDLCDLSTKLESGDI